MTEQQPQSNAPKSLEQQLYEMTKVAQAMESANKEVKTVVDGLIQRCAALACDRDELVRQLQGANEQVALWRAKANGFEEMLKAKAENVAARNVPAEMPASAA